jgi:tripartite-type tricarboxylate transporter receptor subunit TctC
MAREQPRAVTLGHAGVGTGMHLAGSLLQNRTGIRFNEVPYKGGTLAPTAASTGEIVAVIDNLASMDPLLQGWVGRPWRGRRTCRRRWWSCWRGKSPR